MTASRSPLPPFSIGAVSFLNTVPLVNGLQEDPEVQLLLDLPAKLADRLYDGAIEVGLIPIVEYLRGVGGDLVPGICIGSDGPVHSVKVFSKVPLEQAGDIAVDRGSRSSVALLRILLAEMHDHHPDLHILEPNPRNPFERFETVLMIGDRAMEVNEDGLHVYDLGALWKQLTGLPFVFAAWALSSALSKEAAVARREAVIARLRKAHRSGQDSLAELAAREAGPRYGDADAIERYWRDCIRYEMGEAELAGLERFATLAARHNLCAGRDAVSLAQA